MKNIPEAGPDSEKYRRNLKDKKVSKLSKPRMTKTLLSSWGKLVERQATMGKARKYIKGRKKL